MVIWIILLEYRIVQKNMLRLPLMQVFETSADKITKKLSMPSGSFKVLLTVLLFVSILGVGSGYFFAARNATTPAQTKTNGEKPKAAAQDTKTFRDFAEGVIKAKPTPSDPSEYSEGTHLLEREGASPVALTSSVVDLSEYEDKKVKVFGETQSALKVGWLMDVGRIEEIK